METLRSSPYGRIASIYYLRHESVKYLIEELGPEDSIEDLLKTLSVGWDRKLLHDEFSFLSTFRNMVRFLFVITKTLLTRMS